MSYKWIRASEITEYVYCRRAWWLRHTRGWERANIRPLRKGARHHNKHGNQVRKVPLLRGLAYTMLFFIVAYVVFQIIVGGI